MFGAQFSQQFEETGCGLDGATIDAHGLGEHAGQHVAVLVEELLEPLGIVPRQQEGLVGHDVLRSSRGALVVAAEFHGNRMPRVDHTASHDVVGISVVVVLEPLEAIASRVGPRQSQRGL